MKLAGRFLEEKCRVEVRFSSSFLDSFFGKADFLKKSVTFVFFFSIENLNNYPFAILGVEDEGEEQELCDRGCIVQMPEIELAFSLFRSFVPS